MLSNTKRQLLAEGFKDLGNLAAGALVIGQFIVDGKFNIEITIIGFALSVSLYILALVWQP